MGPQGDRFEINIWKNSLAEMSNSSLPPEEVVAPNEPHLSVFMLLGSPLPHWPWIAHVTLRYTQRLKSTYTLGLSIQNAATMLHRNPSCPPERLQGVKPRYPGQHLQLTTSHPSEAMLDPPIILVQKRILTIVSQNHIKNSRPQVG